MMIIPHQNDEFDYLRFLEDSVKNILDFRLFLVKIDDLINKGLIKTAEIDFLSIFKKIQVLVNQNNLWESTHNLESATDLFRQKIADIQNFISSFEIDQIFGKFLLNYSNDDNFLSELLLNSWNSPLLLNGEINQLLLGSYEKLVGRDFTRNIFVFEEPEKTYFNGEFNLNISVDTFEKSLEDFHRFLVNKLPCKFAELFKESKDEGQLYEWFKYCLHLIQKKKIYYDKNLDILQGDQLNE